MNNFISSLILSAALFDGIVFGIYHTNDSLTERNETTFKPHHRPIRPHVTRIPPHHIHEENVTTHLHNVTEFWPENFTSPSAESINLTTFTHHHRPTRPHPTWIPHHHIPEENFTTYSSNATESGLENFTVPAIINVTEIGFRNECTSIFDDIKSKGKPTSVHKLHPANVELIGALGASTMAGFGAGATNIRELSLDYRGLSFAIGGDGNISTVTTLPNILKVYNPNITGYSIGVGLFWREQTSHLNLAVAGAESKDLLNQARRLVRRLRNMRGSSKKWKLISINVGTNDLCKFCLSPPRFSSPYLWVNNIQRALDYLYYNLKNTFVNLISIRSNDLLKHFQRIPACQRFYWRDCPCLNQTNLQHMFLNFEQRLANIVQTYNRIDFAVVFQPFWHEISFIPPTKDNETSIAHNESDISFVALDCFHLSQKGHASAAVALWNNMLEPPGLKKRVWNLYEDKLNCLDPACPYLRTDLNGEFCSLSEEDQEEFITRNIADDSRSAVNTANPVKIELYFFIMITLTFLIIVGAVVTSNVIQARRRNMTHPNERTYLLSNYQI